MKYNTVTFVNIYLNTYSMGFCVFLSVHFKPMIPPTPHISNMFMDPRIPSGNSQWPVVPGGCMAFRVEWVASDSDSQTTQQSLKSWPPLLARITGEASFCSLMGWVLIYSFTGNKANWSNKTQRGKEQTLLSYTQVTFSVVALYPKLTPGVTRLGSGPLPA